LCGGSLACFHGLLKGNQTFLHAALKTCSEQRGNVTSDLAAGWLVFQRETNDGSPLRHGEEMDGAGGIELRARQGPPGNQIVLAVIDDFRVPLDLAVPRTASHPV